MAEERTMKVGARMKVRRISGFSFGLFGLSFAVVACNTLLGNEEGAPAAAPVDAAADAALAPDAGPGDTPTCDVGQRRCFGLCKSVDDPNVGCDDVACVACDPKNVQGASATCKGRQNGTGFGCDYVACDPAFQDCDGNRTNGCETSRNTKANCGACGRSCNGSTGLCALDRSAGTFDCVGTCPTGTQACSSGTCAEVTSDPSNCGACGNVCSRQNAAASCVSSACRYACNQGTKACGDACVSVDDPLFCDACKPCAARPNTEVKCAAGAAAACVYSCTPGFYDCDQNADNGCESKTACVSTIPCIAPCLPGKTCCNNVCILNTLPCAVK
jgi:hypothetical protein